jgi:hypothetical protein
MYRLSKIKFREFPMFYNPPYFLLVAGLFIGLTCGKAFEATLKQVVKDWNQTRSGELLEQATGLSLSLPFFGICVGICVFLASGLNIYGLPLDFSYATSVCLTIGTAILVWSQLKKLLVLLQRGGSRALDLDILE